MIEHPFESSESADRTHTAGGGLDYGLLVDEFRCHTTQWLASAREEAVREQRRWRLRELAIIRVLDERGAVDDTLAQTDGVAIRTVRDTVATARALEDLPAIAQVAAAGRLSDDQLTQVVKLAEPGDDARWAAEAPAWSPADLAQQARLARTPTMAEAAARRAARTLGFWWSKDQGMLDGRFSLPDVDGALFESVINHMIDRMRPAKGGRWETRARRGADALVELCRDYADVQAVSGPPVHMIVEVPLEGPATIAGIPLPDQMVEALRAEARIEPVLCDQTGSPIAVGKTTTSLSAKTIRVIKQRDGKCRWPGCDRRTGLQVHHLWPRSWGGTDEHTNLAAVCTGGGTDHHAQLAPQGPYLLLGNPNNPHGLVVVDRDQLPTLARDQAEHTAYATHDALAGHSEHAGHGAAMRRARREGGRGRRRDPVRAGGP
jgi:hypothetical protein